MSAARNKMQRILETAGFYPRRLPVSSRVSPLEEMRGNLRLQWAHLLWPYVDRPRIAALKNVHADRERCFIIGNGPSLNQLNLTLLKDEITFGANALYLNRDKMGFDPTYHVVSDLLVVEDRYRELNRIEHSQCFFQLERVNLIKRRRNVLFLKQIPVEGIVPGFSTDLTRGIYGGSTVTYYSLQLAYHMGFQQAILIGMDHNYSLNKEHERRAARFGNDEITGLSDDPNHFHPDYFGKGYRWHDPDLEFMENAYRTAREAYEEDGRVVLNATAGGHLEVFERTAYEGLFR